MRAHLLASLFLVVGCGSHAEPRTDHTSSIPRAEAPAYMAKFEGLARRLLNRPDYTIKSEVRMVPDLRNEAGEVVGGLCHPDTLLVELNRTSWDRVNGDIREVIAFHELGHCELFRPHLDTLRADGTKTSLMNSQGLYEEGLYDGNQDYYQTELFSIVNDTYPNGVPE